MCQWVEPEAVLVPADLADTVGGHSLISRILVRRGVLDPHRARAFLDPGYFEPASPDELPDLHQAVDVLVEARNKGRRICVWGDFDVDGQCATALLVEGLGRMGLDVFYHIPHREEGHGLNPLGLARVREQGAEIVLTCDCGVGNHREIEVGRKLGLEIVVTDHHELPEELPGAAAVLESRRLPPGHPLEFLCGTGLAYLLCRALGVALAHEGPQEAGLDLVALGTIADVALLLEDNRYLVQRGLPTLFYQPRTGIEALLRTSGTSPPELPDADVVGFILAPRLNAAGRLAHACTGVELLLTQNQDQAYKRAADLEILNQQRQRLCDQAEAQIESQLQQQPALAQEPALVLDSPEWHPGIIGLVASRLVERYHKPTVLISTAWDGPGRASARSVPGLHIQQVISRHGEFLLGSGGHSMAAGFRINRAHIPAFRAVFQEKVATLITNQRERPAVVVEDYVGLDQVNVELVRDLYRLAPFGAGHPEPILASRQVRLVNMARMGRGGAHTRLVLEDRQGRQVQAVWWRKAPGELPSDWVDAAFKLRLDDHQGEASVRLELVAVRAERIVAIHRQAEPEKLPFVVVDKRGASERGLILQDLLQQHGLNIQVWAEDEDMPQLDRARARDRLEPGADLIIWSTPPGPQVLRSVLEKLRPRQVYLLTREGNPPSVTQFLRVLGGLVKSILVQRQGQIHLEELAARLGHREATVLQGMDYLVGMGKLRYRLFEGRIYIEARSAPGRQSAQGEALKQLLQETAAYRRYFNQADAEQLLVMSCDKNRREP